MPNKNYIAGRAFEYLLKKHYEKSGYNVLRTAGSHGDFDLVAYKAYAPVIMIQCKCVSTEKAGENLINKFRSKPPMPPGVVNFHQYLAVKVRGAKGFLGVTV